MTTWRITGSVTVKKPFLRKSKTKQITQDFWAEAKQEEKSEVCQIIQELKWIKFSCHIIFIIYGEGHWQVQQWVLTTIKHSGDCHSLELHFNQCCWDLVTITGTVVWTQKVPSDYETQCNSIWKKCNWPRLHFSASHWHIVQCPHLKSPWKCSCPEGWLFWCSALRQNRSNYQLISNLHAFMRHVHKTLPSSIILLLLLRHQFSPSLHFIWKRCETTSVVS